MRGRLVLVAPFFLGLTAFIPVEYLATACTSTCSVVEKKSTRWVGNQTPDLSDITLKITGLDMLKKGFM